MNKFSIFYCEDDSTSNAVIESFLLELKLKYSNISYNKITFDEIIINKSLDTTQPNLLILDLLDGKDKKLKGMTVLTIIKSSQKNIPTIVYSLGKTGSKEDVNLTQLKKDFNFVIETIKKFNDSTDEELKNVIEIEILKKLPSQYSLKNENDLILQLQISSILEVNLNQIINQIKEKFDIKENIVLERMISGYSGAMLIKFKYQNTFYILKLSNEISKLELEFDNSLKYYHKFPSKFFNYISPEKFYSTNKKTLGILIKLVEDSTTLFDVIGHAIDFSQEIEPLLIDIFINSHSLKKHYLEQRGNEEHWSSIFNKISGIKFSIIDNVYQELKPLIPDSINFSVLKNLVLNHCYENLDKTKLHKKYTSVLCHGDLHSRNIVIQGNHSFLIDTGGIDYYFWCFDICRLIVDLFINGIDSKTRNYYDINKISENISMAQLIIEQNDNIPFDGRNDNIIKTINWLLSNCSNIYGDSYCKFEFQLGLMKEFLQASCRVGTISHNKRAIAFIAAYECLVKANESALIDA